MKSGEHHVGIEQGTMEWHLLRLGKVTASCVTDVMATTKSGTESAGRRNYRAQLVVERLTGKPTETYMNGAMQWGKDQEASAREVYQFMTGNEVSQVTFIEHPTITMAGCSPDGLIGDDGMLEIKCPNTATHIENILSGKAPSDYIKQIQFQMACAGRLWVDFFSYDPRMPHNLQGVVYRVNRDQAMIDGMEREIVKFLDEVTNTVGDLLRRAE